MADEEKEANGMRSAEDSEFVSLLMRKHNFAPHIHTSFTSMLAQMCADVGVANAGNFHFQSQSRRHFRYQCGCFSLAD